MMNSDRAGDGFGEVSPRPEHIRDRTFRFAVAIVRLCYQLERTSGVSRTLAGQLLKAGTSVGANTEEGQAAQSKADFIHKFSIALKEARESGYWLRLLDTAGESAACHQPQLLKEAGEIGCILASIIVSAKRRRD
jgi:four helix bundle protein